MACGMQRSLIRQVKYYFPWEDKANKAKFWSSGSSVLMFGGAQMQGITAAPEGATVLLPQGGEM